MTAVADPSPKAATLLAILELGAPVTHPVGLSDNLANGVSLAESARRLRAAPGGAQPQ